MDQNPLSDILTKAKQYKIESDLAEIKGALNILLGGQTSMTHFVEVTKSDGGIVAVNPAYVVAICDGPANKYGIKEGGVIIYHDNTTLETKETREMLTALLNGCSGKTPIG